MGVHKEEQEEKRGNRAASKYVEESERTLWCQGTTPKRNKNEHERVDHKVGSSNVGRMQRV